jgi:hypothetical protein
MFFSVREFEYRLEQRMSELEKRRGSDGGNQLNDDDKVISMTYP